MSKVIVSGSIAYDRIMDYAGNFTDSFMADKLHTLSVSFQVERIKEEFGGVAGNLAYNLKLLGEEPQMVGSGGALLQRLRARPHRRENGVERSRASEADAASRGYAWCKGLAYYVPRR